MRKLLIALALCFAASVVVCGSVLMITSKNGTTSPQLSDQEWKKHKERIFTFTKAPFATRDSYEMFQEAVKLSDLGYIRDCRDPGCSELRHLLSSVKKASGTGRLTPRELEDLKQDALFVTEALNAEDRRRKP